MRFEGFGEGCVEGGRERGPCEWKRGVVSRERKGFGDRIVDV